MRRFETNCPRASVLLSANSALNSERKEMTPGVGSNFWFGVDAHDQIKYKTRSMLSIFTGLTSQDEYRIASKDNWGRFLSHLRNQNIKKLDADFRSKKSIGELRLFAYFREKKLCGFLQRSLQSSGVTFWRKSFEYSRLLPWPLERLRSTAMNLRLISSAECRS